MAALQIFCLFLVLLCFWFSLICLELQGLQTIHYVTFERVLVKTLALCSYYIKLYVPFHLLVPFKHWFKKIFSLSFLFFLLTLNVFKKNIAQCKAPHLKYLTFTSFCQQSQHCAVLPAFLAMVKVKFHNLFAAAWDCMKFTLLAYLGLYCFLKVYSKYNICVYSSCVIAFMPLGKISIYFQGPWSATKQQWRNCHYCRTFQKGGDLLS